MSSSSVTPLQVRLVAADGTGHDVAWAAASLCVLVAECFEAAEEPSRIDFPAVGADALGAVVALLEDFVELDPAVRAFAEGAAALAPGAGRRGDRGRLAALAVSLDESFPAVGPAWEFPGECGAAADLVRALDHLRADAPLTFLLVAWRSSLWKLCLEARCPVVEDVVRTRLPAMQHSGNVERRWWPGPGAARVTVKDFPLCSDSVESVALLTDGELLSEKKCWGRPLFVDAVAESRPLRRLCVKMQEMLTTAWTPGFQCAIVTLPPPEEIVVAVGGYILNRMRMIGGELTCYDDIVDITLARARKSVTIVVWDTTLAWSTWIKKSGKSPVEAVHHFVRSLAGRAARHCTKIFIDIGEAGLAADVGEAGLAADSAGEPASRESAAGAALASALSEAAASINPRAHVRIARNTVASGSLGHRELEDALAHEWPLPLVLYGAAGEPLLVVEPGSGRFT